MSFDTFLNSFFTGIDQFHFIRPEWLWAIPVLLLLWLITGTIGKSTHWESFIAKDKLEALRVTGGRYSKAWRWLLILGWIIATFAASGPAWKQVPVPTVRDESALVIVLDLSRSMLAQDIAPDRLTRSKYKLIDILRARGDGQTALVAYAGDPHTVSPLTDDPRTIEALLPALHPAVMPIQGSNTEAAIDLSIQLLRDAGVSQGEILLLTDGVASDAQKYIRDLFDGSFKLSVLGIGSTDAVPIPQENGGFFTDSRGEIILTKLNRDELQILAGLSGGRYVELQPDDSDIQYLLKDNFEKSEGPDDTDTNALLYDSWEDMGYWLVLLILPFAAYSFRKGAVYAIPLMIFVLPNDSQAFSIGEAWDDLWLNKDQQGAKLMQEANPVDAAEVFENQDWAGVADFEAQNYQSAAERFAESTDISNIYNRGNALAFSGNLEAALEAYEQVLEQSPEHEDAAHNKAVIEQLMQQQEQQQQESGESGEDSQNQENDSQESQNEDSQSQQGESSEESSQQGSQQQDSQEQQGQQSESGEESESEQQAQSQQEKNSDQQAGEESQPDKEQSEEEKEAQARQSSEEDESADEQSEQEIAAGTMPAEATPDELQDTSEQWLRAIPDDPSGLLRRKFDYESRQNKLEQRYRLQIPTNPDDERY